MSIYSLVSFLRKSDVDLPGSFKVHCFEKLKTIVRRNNPELESRDQFINAKKWDSVSDDGLHSNSDISTQLISSSQFDSNATKEEIENNLVTKAYHELSNSEIEAMKADFHSIRRDLYQRILAAEAERLNCDISEIRPTVPVHLLYDSETESKLCQLPDDVFENILTRLDTIEVYRTTLVCRKWRHFVYKNSAAFKRIEYAPTTHLITFTEWMNPSSDESIKDCLTRFDSFGWSLMKWCCEIFQNLETCILKGLDLYSSQVRFLLKKSLNLKNLQFSVKGRRSTTKVHSQFSNLEMLIVDKSRHRFSSNIVRGAFINSSQLRGFKGELTNRCIMKIEAKNSVAFSNLIALELISVEYKVLETLSKIHHLKLRYLKLGDTSNMQRYSFTSSQFKRRAVIASHNLLSRLGHLKVLVIIFPIALTCESIRLLTKLRLNLTQACIRLDRLSSQNQRDNEMGIRDHADPRTTIASFAKMLVKQDSSVDLSAFELIVDDEVSRSVLQGANTGLSIYNRHDDRSLYYDTLSLSHPVMRRQLGIDF